MKDIAPRPALNPLAGDTLAPGKTPIRPFEGVKLHLETEKIAVWEEHFPPGEATQAHRHTRDYICIALTDIDLTVDPVAGEFVEQLTVLINADKGCLDGNRGKFPKGVVFHSHVSRSGAAHVAFNNTDETSKLLIIEIKGTGLDTSSKDC